MLKQPILKQPIRMLKNVKQPIRMLKNVQGPIRMPKMRITLYFAEKFDYIPDPVHKKSST